MNEFSLLNDRTPTEEKNVENENQPQTFEEPTKQSAGLIKIPERTFEYDLAIGDRYQNFSAEMLRLALLGITAIGFLLLNFFLGTSDKAPEAFGIAKKTLANSDFRFYIFSSLYLFGFSAGFALLHRFFTSDSLAYHLKYLRLREKIRLTKQTKTTENVSHLIQHSQRSFFDGFW
ncbi:MAG TPA: hypothetical protein VEQ34_00615, partial [Pyrinomonadaceae bacterium]|nr:hypothetical protein [Pyrinomonadaceae bacterium]